MAELFLNWFYLLAVFQKQILKRFPDNTDPELVALKIALIDMTNSTNIGRHRQKIVVTELADFIVSIKDFDARIRQGDPSLVPTLAKNTGKKRKKNFYPMMNKSLSCGKSRKSRLVQSTTRLQRYKTLSKRFIEE